MIRYFFAVAALAIVAGCQTAEVDTAVQRSLPAMCNAAETARPVLALASEAGKLTGRRKAAVDAAFGSLDTICVDPASQTAASVLVAAVAAYLTISTALEAVE